MKWSHEVNRPGAVNLSSGICIYMDCALNGSPRCVCATLRKATRAVTTHFDNTLRPAGLRATQFNILAEIFGAGEASITQLTRTLVMDQTTLTRGLALLERNGLLSTVPKPDGRVKYVRLTKKGERTLKTAFPLWASAQASMLQLIGHDAWAVLSGQLDRIAQRPNV